MIEESEEKLKEYLEEARKRGIEYPEPVRITIDRGWNLEFTLWSDGKETCDQFNWRTFHCPEGWFRDRSGGYYNRDYYREEKDNIGAPYAVRF